MSKPGQYFVFLILGVLLTLAAPSLVASESKRSDPRPILGSLELQYLDGRPVAIVHGSFKDQQRTKSIKGLSFVHSIAGVSGLADRLRNLTLRGTDGQKIPFRTLSTGEFLAEKEIASWSYAVELSPPSQSRITAHASWVHENAGLLMLYDLLPRLEQGRSDGLIHLKVPEGWGVSEEKVTPIIQTPSIPSGEWFEASSDSVFLIGKRLRNQKVISAPDVRLVVTGEWHFSDLEASDLLVEVYSEYGRRFGRGLFDEVEVGLFRLPSGAKPGEWQAETRGRNVTIISSDMPFKTQSLQRLHEQLRHELFHLWIPNGVNLTGNYDWFYEGFALYESLRLGVAVNRIRFEDFLDTLSRAHTIDSAGSQRASLIQMSSNRFSGANTQVYARGMLVGFLCDLAMLQQSKGKRSVEDLLKELFAKHRKPAAPVDGNTTILALLRSNPTLIPIVEKYIAGADKLEWTSELAGAGIEDTDASPLTSLRVKAKLNGRQKDLLDKLGYNNWRKLAPTSK